MPQGSFGRLRVGEHFLGAPDVTTGGTTALTRVAGLTQLAVGAPTLAQTVDEPGGVLSTQTGGSNDNNCVYFAGPFKPADGGCYLEARLKQNDVTLGAIWVGFTETLATTPVMPSEFATVTMTYNGSGGMIGLVYDPDATTNDWRAVGGDGGAVSGDADANGTAASDTSTNDEYDIIRVEIDPDGRGRVYLNEKLVKNVGVAVTPGDVQHAIVMIEARTAAARIMEMDYFLAEGNVDWTV